MNESKIELTERLRAEGRWGEASRFKDETLRTLRSQGMTKAEAGEEAWKRMADKYPPQAQEEVAAVNVRVQGLADLPEGWPELPGNASLQAEVKWVTANRLRVRTSDGVDLSRALSPAPSHAALSWLETAITFPSKFADISVKATAKAEDEQAVVKRERMAIEEVRELLAEMLEDGDAT